MRDVLKPRTPQKTIDNGTLLKQLRTTLGCCMVSFSLVFRCPMVLRPGLFSHATKQMFTKTIFYHKVFTYSVHCMVAQAILLKMHWQADVL